MTSKKKVVCSEQVKPISSSSDQQVVSAQVTNEADIKEVRVSETHIQADPPIEVQEQQQQKDKEERKKREEERWRKKKKKREMKIAELEGKIRSCR